MSDFLPVSTINRIAGEHLSCCDHGSSIPNMILCEIDLLSSLPSDPSSVADLNAYLAIEDTAVAFIKSAIRSIIARAERETQKRACHTPEALKERELTRASNALAFYFD